MNREKMEHHYASLKEVHSVLDKEIDQKTRTGNFTDAELENLKKKRLKIKDDMEVLSKRIRGVI
jgi:uncharacterized protein YdcH (DUF465 family)